MNRATKVGKFLVGKWIHFPALNFSTFLSLPIILAVALAGLILSPGRATAQHQDILVYLNGGVVRVGGYDFTVNLGDSNYVVFSAPLQTTEASPGGAYIDAPGWNAVSNPLRLPAGGAVLPTNTGVHFDFLPAPLLGRNLQYWNGSNAVAFGPVPGGEVLSYSTGPTTLAVADGSTNRVTGFTVVTTGNSGTFHKHVYFVLYGDAARNPLSSDAPTDGIYLLTMAVRLAGTTNFSNPFWVLLGWHASNAQLEQAESWMNQTLAHPAPPQLALSATTGGGAMSLRLTAPVGHQFSLEGTGDFQTWTQLGPVVSTNAETLLPLQPTNAAAFFRVRRIAP